MNNHKRESRTEDTKQYIIKFSKRVDDSWNWHISNKMQYALSIITLWMDRFPT